eukprot:Nitzschia sp. Nitz4//scaffold150_size53981//32792//33286//NITZ4_006679-RA/size53981-processed-gene-0.17-mRNA-1//1//CDS//3329537077//6010//frame0
MISTVVRGFGRGSKDLGIPTANLDPNTAHFCCATSVADLPTGIYWGFARIDSEATTYKTACSVGFNPVYGNDHKTIEPHLIAPTDDPHRHVSTCGESVLGDFYDKKIRLSLVGYLRPELPFEGLEKLIEAIKKDILDTETLGDGQEEITLQEKAWVASSDDVSK